MVHIIISLQNLVCVPSENTDILQNEMLKLKYLQSSSLRLYFLSKQYFIILFIHKKKRKKENPKNSFLINSHYFRYVLFFALGFHKILLFKQSCNIMPWNLMVFKQHPLRYQQCGLPSRMCIDPSLEPPYCLALVFRISPELVI